MTYLTVLSCRQPCWPAKPLYTLTDDYLDIHHCHEVAVARGSCRYEKSKFGAHEAKSHGSVIFSIHVVQI